MLKPFFDLYIDPNAVGWINREQVFNDPSTPNLVRRDVITVTSKSGIKITEQVLTAFDVESAYRNGKCIERAIIMLGAEIEGVND